jgi:uncharacterized membrane protein YhaH (DUF805 family)
MSPVLAVKRVLSQYAVFSGRARRAEFWWFYLFGALAIGIGFALDAALFGTGEATTTATSASVRVDAGPVTAVVALALLLPYLGVAVRRLHDTDRRGWWVLVGLVPLLGTVLLLVLWALDSTPGGNRFGSSPKGADAVAAPAGGAVAA